MCVYVYIYHNINLRGKCKKLFKIPYRLNITGNFFANRTVNIWNAFNNDVVMSRNCNTFKHVLQNIALFYITRGRTLLD